MVGHTGIFPAAMKAAESVDDCLSNWVPKAQKMGYDIMIIADHGNSDYMVNDDGTPNTAHSLNPVPCILVTEKFKDIKMQKGILADVAPSILTLMGIDKPEVMRDSILFETEKVGDLS
jgi:2,3-bisphosphoglycerate-independent phosphoglycerate mutase